MIKVRHWVGSASDMGPYVNFAVCCNCPEPKVNHKRDFTPKFLEALTAHYGTSIYTPFTDLPERFQKILYHGSGAEPITYYFDRGASRIRFTKPFEGIIPNLERRYRETDSTQTREDIKRFMTFQACPECHGAKLNPASRAVTIAGVSLSALCALTVSKACRFCMGLRFQGQQEPSTSTAW